jgi:hypothetical protein
MADIYTLEELAELKAAYKAALFAVTHAQEYSIGNRRYTRADLPEIRKTLEHLAAEESRMTAGAAPGPQCVPAIPSR